ncbi:MAG: homocysteine S-methyltransferase family protein [Bacteroidales bacterium]
MRKSLEEAAKQKILILDGAMGTMIQRHKLGEEDFRGKRFSGHPSLQKGNNDLLVLTRPDIIGDIHREYLEAGADIITTNTFNSNMISMADYGMTDLVHELNYEAAKLAKGAVSAYEKSTGTTGHFVAGTLGPTNRTASMSADVNDPGARSVSFDDLVDAYSGQVRGLIDGGVDILLVETIFDVPNCKAALFAIDTVFGRKRNQVALLRYSEPLPMPAAGLSRVRHSRHSLFQYPISLFQR